MKKYITLAALFISGICLQQPAAAQVKKVQAVGITVSDMDRAVQFYSDVLQFRKISDTEVYGTPWEKLFGIFGIRMRIVRLQLGEEQIELIDYLTPGGRSIPETAKSNDLSFQHLAIVVSDMDSAYHWLRNHHVQHVSTGPQTLPASIPAATGIRAFYFQDPDKHNLEIIYFPKGKGQEKWQQAGNRIFLGIDHTAIGISNTSGSHAFYSIRLGIERKGDSWNKGMEQEHLNNVQGASLHITGYRAPEGPGVEFLQYLSPGPGKKYPADTRSDDIWSWHTIVEVDNADAEYRRLKAAGIPLISSGPVTIMQNDKPLYTSFLARDPDGHAVMFRQVF